MKTLKSIFKLFFLTTIVSVFMTSCQKDEINSDEEIVVSQPDEIGILDSSDLENAMDLSKTTYHYKSKTFTPEEFDSFSTKNNFSNIEIVPVDQNNAYAFDNKEDASNFIGNEFNLDTNNNDFVNQRNS